MAPAYGATVTDIPTPALVATGGVAGAAVRWAVDAGLDDATVAGGSAPVLLVNIAGAFLLGWLLASPHAKRSRVVALIGIGFCGSLTTMSTLAVDTAVRLDRGEWTSGLGGTALHVALGIGAVLIGTRLAGREATP